MFPARTDVTRSEIESFFHLSTTIGRTTSTPTTEGTTTSHDDDSLEWRLAYPLEAVIGLTTSSSSSSSSFSRQAMVKQRFAGSTWVHDDELGRGYLLLSDSSSSGMVWRWEVGGGPITIGRSLFLKDSGCRSGLWADCSSSSFGSSFSPNNSDPSLPNVSHWLLGSGGITVQPSRETSHFHSGRIVVAERGERRIVRMEEDGARTPLVIRVPSLFRPTSNVLEEETEGREGNETTTTMVRLNDPGGVLMYTPFGDLLFTDRRTRSFDDDDDDDDSKGTVSSVCSTKTMVAGLYRLREAVNIPSIDFKSSRIAHEWDDVSAAGETHATSLSSSSSSASDIEVL